MELLQIIHFGQHIISKINNSSIISGLYKTENAFALKKYEERGKGFASNILDVIQLWGETVDYQTTEGQDSH